ncbi:MAG TPA: DUF1127 domain-containing protein [Candidatus Angelobacter sp.]|nr:DUF1127 domain-containing protein [Candidatus Angelobacter sp.]
MVTWPPSRTDRWRTGVAAAFSTIALWWQRGRSRRVLATLDDHRLHDIGISRADALFESAKPFWRL